jgi:mRNA interferase MazF
LAESGGRRSLEGFIENLIKGDVVSVPFPFSDTPTTKRRPALIIAESDKDNILVCPITSKPGRENEIKLEDQDFRVGKLNLSPCYIRSNIIATVDKSNVIRFIGKVKEEKLNQVIAAIIDILQKSPEPPSTSKALERGKSPK